MLLAQDSLESRKSVSPAWITNSLQLEHPRLIFTEGVEEQLKAKIATDSIIQQYGDFVISYADQVLGKTFLQPKMDDGKRMLSVARESFRRITALAVAFRLTNRVEYLERLQKEIETVISFESWNPSHFLDVAEMSMAVTLGIDWCYDELPADLIRRAKEALIEKGLKPALEEEHGWVTGTNNWNQVCHGGMVISSLLIAEDEPELASRIINRALQNVDLALQAYAPDGAFVEGPMYWEYGTYFTVLMLDAMESALGSDFDISDAPGFMNTGNYRAMMNAPSGMFFNYSDSKTGSAMGFAESGLLSWFAVHSPNGLRVDLEFISNSITAMMAKTSVPRFVTFPLFWLAYYEENSEDEYLNSWKGAGDNPVVVFRDDKSDKNAFFLGVKGGKASNSHGHMDAGSFVFELFDVRWSVDLPIEPYALIESYIGEELWNMAQDSRRWHVLSKSNFGHSNLTVNNELHLAEGFAPIIEFLPEADHPSVTMDLSGLYGNKLANVTRKLTKTSPTSIRIADHFELTRETESISWAMMTYADLEPTDTGVLLRQNGKSVTLSIAEPKGATVEIKTFNQDPLPYNKVHAGVKRIEIKIPIHKRAGPTGSIVVDIKG